MRGFLKGFFTTALVMIAAVLWPKWVTHVGIERFFGAPLLALLLPLLMPTRMWLAGCVSFFALAAIILLAQHVYVSSSSTHDGNMADGLGVALVLLALIAVGAAAGVRLLLGAAWARLTRAQ